MSERVFDKVITYTERGADPFYGHRALDSAASEPDSNLIGFSYGEPIHTNVTLKRNKAGVTIWIYKSDRLGELP